MLTVIYTTQRVLCTIYSEHYIVHSVLCILYTIQYTVECVLTLYHSWSVCTLRTKKTERTLRTKKPKAHIYFPEIKYKVTIHILV